MPTLLIILSKTILFYKIFSILKYLFNYTKAQDTRSPIKPM